MVILSSKNYMTKNFFINLFTIEQIDNIHAMEGQ